MKCQFAMDSTPISKRHRDTGTLKPGGQAQQVSLLSTLSHRFGLKILSYKVTALGNGLAVIFEVRLYYYIYQRVAGIYDQICQQ